MKPSLGPGQWFRTDASEVLGSLRNRVAGILSELGDFRGPAEVQRALRLDKTLSRQVYKLGSTADALVSGGIVPSRTSITRFLDAARARGVETEKLDGVTTAYAVFEQLVQTHAGDRVTFNSMIAAASGMDEEWIAADTQHRRNAFRAMSHAMGVQAKTRLHLMIVDEAAEGRSYDVAGIAGFVGLRVLRAQPSIRIYSLAFDHTTGTDRISSEPLGLSDAVGGYLLEDYSSKPLPTLEVVQGTNGLGHWKQIAVCDPEVGNVGASTLVFGSVYRDVPAVNQPLRLHVTTGRPAEVLLFDVLKRRGTAGAAKPSGQAVLGYNEKFGTEVVPVEGKFEPELLGTGPAALATPEVPHYADMLRSIGTKLGWNLSEFDAWRIRVECPLYQSTVIISWNAAQE